MVVKYLRIIFTACLVSLLICISACTGDLKYGEGKDTVQAYGDGTYQILHHKDGDREVKQLMDCKHEQCVMTQIDAYTSIENSTYFVGKYYTKQVWCKLSVENNCLYYYVENGADDAEFVMVYLADMKKDNQIVILSSFDEFSEEDQKVFMKYKFDK